MAQNNFPKKYLLGVDIGSSKTHALISDSSGRALSFSESGCGNYEVVGPEGMANAIRTAVSDCLNDLKINKSEILGMGFGISGYDWPSEKLTMLQAIETLDINAKISLVNDAEIGLIAGSVNGWGIAVDAGTGNNIRGRDKQGRIGRITGDGLAFGEFGGGSELVWLGRTAVTYAWSQRGPKTKLTSIFMKHAGVDNEDALIEGLVTNKIELPSILAKEIISAAMEGDNVALEVVQFSARELAKNVNAVIKQLELKNESFDIVMIGSLFKAGEIYITPFSQTILDFAPNARFTPLKVPPVFGAVFLAAENVNLLTNGFRNTLNQSSKILFNQRKMVV